MRLLRVGCKGEDVRQLQTRLNEFYETIIDGDFGPDTKSSVESFQDDNGLNVDGVVGPITWTKLFGTPPPEEEVPDLLMQSDLKKIMGDPADPAFRANWIVWIDLHDYVAHGLIPSTGLSILNKRAGFYGNKWLKDPMLEAMELLKERGFIKEWKTFDGCWVVRKMKGGNSWSIHSWGMAVDINAAWNPFNSQKHQLSDGFVNCFADAGFECGGWWNSPKDWMHFQNCYTTKDWASRLDGTPFNPPARWAPEKPPVQPEPEPTDDRALIIAECQKQGLTIPEQIAYVLATVQHETAGTYKPVKEAYWKDEAWREANLTRYYPFYGRGYVQLTWESNYQKYADILGIDLVGDPDLALEPKTAAFILVHGFKTGAFTGKKITDYIDEEGYDFVEARRCINGLDKCDEIAALAEKHLSQLA